MWRPSTPVRASDVRGTWAYNTRSSRWMDAARSLWANYDIVHIRGRGRRDVRTHFATVARSMASMLQEHDGSFLWYLELNSLDSSQVCVRLSVTSEALVSLLKSMQQTVAIPIVIGLSVYLYGAVRWNLVHVDRPRVPLRSWSTNRFLMKICTDWWWLTVVLHVEVFL